MLRTARLAPRTPASALPICRSVLPWVRARSFRADEGGAAERAGADPVERGAEAPDQGADVERDRDLELRGRGAGDLGARHLAAQIAQLAGQVGAHLDDRVNPQLLPRGRGDADHDARNGAGDAAQLLDAAGRERAGQRPTQGGEVGEPEPGGAEAVGRGQPVEAAIGRQAARAARRPAPPRTCSSRRSAGSTARTRSPSATAISQTITSSLPV